MASAMVMDFCEKTSYNPSTFGVYWQLIFIHEEALKNESIVALVLVIVSE